MKEVTCFLETPFECQIKVPDYLGDWDGFSAWEVRRYERPRATIQALISNKTELVWISIHPDQSLKHYNIDSSKVIELMNKLGYKEEFLGSDHEEHYYFYKK